MALLNGFKIQQGQWTYKSRLTTASTAIERQDALKTTSGKLLVATTSAKLDGVANEVKLVGDSATTAIQYIMAYSGRTRWLAGEKGATSIAATDEGALVDLKGSTGAMGFDSNVNTNKDIFIDKVKVAGAINVGEAIIVFGDPSWHHATN